MHVAQGQTHSCRGQSHALYDRQRQTLVTTRCPADQRIGHTFRNNGQR